jgi:hypothetical protein
LGSGERERERKMMAVKIKEVDQVFSKEHMAAIGRNGGRSRSAAKLKAIRENLRKAMRKRFPRSAKWR